VFETWASLRDRVRQSIGSTVMTRFKSTIHHLRTSSWLLLSSPLSFPARMQPRRGATIIIDEMDAQLFVDPVQDAEKYIEACTTLDDVADSSRLDHMIVTQSCFFFPLPRLSFFFPMVRVRLPTSRETMAWSGTAACADRVCS